VRDLATGATLPTQVPNTGGERRLDCRTAAAFSTHSSTTTTGRQGLLHQARHDPVADDRLIYSETDPGLFVGVGGTRDNRLDHHFDQRSRDVGASHTIPPDIRWPKPKGRGGARAGLQYDLEEGGDVFFILTNADGAKDFKVMTAPASDPDPGNWRELMPHEPGRLILSDQSFRDWLVRLERGRPAAHRRARPRNRRGARDRLRRGSLFARPVGSYEYDTDTIRFTYSSMTTPRSCSTTTCARASAPCARRRKCRRATIRRLRHPPPDGARPDGELVPVSCSTAPGTCRSTAPRRCLLYGYGSYGISIPAAFNTTACRWSIAASSTPSPMSAAARTRATPGTRTASARTRPTPSPTSSPPPRHLIARATRRRRASSRRAARPAAC
jgi:oligopeptidase B